MKINADDFSKAGDKYLGVPYAKMDCQEFVERCMSDCGLRMNLPGSNSWYREIRKDGWTGTPEECRKIFGYIPKGAILFIREPVSEKTPEKFRKDGIGDITHMGIRTGRGRGAIHSSSSRGCVAESEFHDRTIPNGGWNRIGLYNRFDYGKNINWLLDHIGIGEKPQEEETIMMASVYSENRKPVNLRKSINGDLLDRMPVGSGVEILQSGEEWSKVRWGSKTGWVKSEFLSADDSGIPSEDFDDDQDPDDGYADDQDGDATVSLTFTVRELSALLPVLQSMEQQIINKAGRG